MTTIYKNQVAKAVQSIMRLGIDHIIVEDNTLIVKTAIDLHCALFLDTDHAPTAEDVFDLQLVIGFIQQVDDELAKEPQ